MAHASSSNRSQNPAIVSGQSVATLRRIRTVLHDAHTLFMQGMKQVLDAHPGIHVVGCVADARQLEREVQRSKPDVLVTELAMNAGLTLKDIIGVTLAACPDTRIVAISGISDVRHPAEAEQTGAHAYLPKSATTNELVDAIEQVHLGAILFGPDLPPSVAKQLAEPQNCSPARRRVPLTESEQRILRQVATGSTNHDIAVALNLSEKTVRNKLCDIYNKLHIRNRTQAAIYAVSEGLVEL